MLLARRIAFSGRSLLASRGAHSFSFHSRVRPRRGGGSSATRVSAAPVEARVGASGAHVRGRVFFSRVGTSRQAQQSWAQRWFPRLVVGGGIAVATVYYTFREPVPLVDRRHFVAMSRRMEAVMGNAIFKAMLDSDDCETLPPEHDDTKLVASVGRRIAQVTGLPDYEWEFVVVRSPVINAFCLPGGKVVVNTGLLESIRRDRRIGGPELEEVKLAVVLAHEVGHAVARHVAESVSRGMLMTIPLVTLVLGASPLLAWFYQMLYELPFSRLHETEADFLGMMLMAAAGYDPKVAPTFWAFADTIFSLPGRATTEPPVYISTHPAHAMRYHNCELWVRQALVVQKHVLGDDYVPAMQLQHAPMPLDYEPDGAKVSVTSGSTTALIRKLRHMDRQAGRFSDDPFQGNHLRSRGKTVG